MPSTTSDDRDDAPFRLDIISPTISTSVEHGEKIVPHIERELKRALRESPRLRYLGQVLPHIGSEGRKVLNISCEYDPIVITEDYTAADIADAMVNQACDKIIAMVGQTELDAAEAYLDEMDRIEAQHKFFGGVLPPDAFEPFVPPDIRPNQWLRDVPTDEYRAWLWRGTDFLEKGSDALRSEARKKTSVWEEGDKGAEPERIFEVPVRDVMPLSAKTPPGEPEQKDFRENRFVDFLENTFPGLLEDSAWLLSLMSQVPPPEKPAGERGEDAAPLPDSVFPPYLTKQGEWHSLADEEKADTAAMMARRIIARTWSAGDIDRLEQGGRITPEQADFGRRLQERLSGEDGGAFRAALDKAQTLIGKRDNNGRLYASVAEILLHGKDTGDAAIAAAIVAALTRLGETAWDEVLDLPNAFRHGPKTGLNNTIKMLESIINFLKSLRLDPAKAAALSEEEKRAIREHGNAGGTEYDLGEVNVPVVASPVVSDPDAPKVTLPRTDPGEAPKTELGRDVSKVLEVGTEIAAETAIIAGGATVAKNAAKIARKALSPKTAHAAEVKAGKGAEGSSGKLDQTASPSKINNDPALDSIGKSNSGIKVIDRENDYFLLSAQGKSGKIEVLADILKQGDTLILSNRL